MDTACTSKEMAAFRWAATRTVRDTDTGSSSSRMAANSKASGQKARNTVTVSTSRPLMTARRVTGQTTPEMGGDTSSLVDLTSAVTTRKDSGSEEKGMDKENMSSGTVRYSKVPLKRINLWLKNDSLVY